jgi:penicillin-binding protein 1C
VAEKRIKRLGLLGLAVALGMALAAWKTSLDMLPFPQSLRSETLRVTQPRILDRHDIPLSITYVNPWNSHDWIPLHRIPALLRQAFILSEDKRFFRHDGVDWVARCHAIVQNLAARRVVRGASTLSEQVVRMLHPRPRTLWSRWVEGFEARALEARFSKAEILEFYLSQVPYARQRRGVAQAARLYFDRDLHLLNERETLALAVLVRSPSRLDLFRTPSALDESIDGLAQRLHQAGTISSRGLQLVLSSPLQLQTGRLPVMAAHYVRHVLARAVPADSDGAIRRTTLDATLQGKLQNILDSALRDLSEQDATSGAILVADHQSSEILAWVNGGGTRQGPAGSWFDAVTLPRQPGSTLKPFLYALAMEKGWTPATILDDSPLSEPLRSGMHVFRNYSRIHHGPLRLREALGNSLNIPAVRAIQFTGARAFLQRLRELGFASLVQSHDHYGHGLALGDGEVSLLELTQAYACLARGGRFHPLIWNGAADGEPRPSPRVMSQEVASLVAHILADPQARRLEFGEGHLLSLPVETAVKTGTSSDHRDAWAVGFSHRHVVGIWMGNLDRTPTRGLTGTTGPGLVLRAVFRELNEGTVPGSLPLSPRLARQAICQKSGRLPGPGCPRADELFVPGSEPRERCELNHGGARAAFSPVSAIAASSLPVVQLLQPTGGLELAMDPRVPDDLEVFPLVLPRGLPYMRVVWLMDGVLAGVTGTGVHRWDWSMRKGTHKVLARVWLGGSVDPVETPPVTFVVR